MVRILVLSNAIWLAGFREFNCSVLKVEREALGIIMASLETLHDVTDLVLRPRVTKEGVIYVS